MSVFVNGEGEGKQTVSTERSDKGRTYVVTVEQDYYLYNVMNELITYRHGLTARAWTRRGAEGKAANLRRRVRNDILTGKAQTITY